MSHQAPSNSTIEKFSSERLIYNLSGFTCLVMILLLGFSSGRPDGTLMQTIGLYWHFVGIIVFFVIGLFSVMCIIHVNSLDSHPSLVKHRKDFHSLRPAAKKRAYVGPAANANSGIRKIANN